MDPLTNGHGDGTHAELGTLSSVSGARDTSDLTATEAALIGKAEGPVAQAFAQVEAEMNSEVTGAEMESVKRRIRAALKRKVAFIERLTALQADLNLITTQCLALDAAIAKAKNENDPSDLPADPLVVGKVVQVLDETVREQQRQVLVAVAEGRVIGVAGQSCGCPACSSARRGRLC